MMRKRLFLAAGFAVFAGLSIALYALLIEPHMMFVRHHVVGETQADKANTIRIVHLSDLHIESVHVSPARVRRIVKAINAQTPDIVIITGDYVNGHASKADLPAKSITNIEAGLAALGGIEAAQGVFATLGNHDEWYGKADIVDALQTGGLRVLENQAVMLDDTLCLVGLADDRLGLDDPAAFAGCPPQSKIIAAMHSPDSFVHMPAGALLGLAGHTHGGQVNLPFLGRRVNATDVGQPYAYGLKDWRGTPVYISAGIGTSILPIRFRSPPEIAVFELLY